MAVRQGASDPEERIHAWVDDGALEQSAQCINELRGHAGEIGEGFAADSLAFTPGLSEQDGGFVGLVGDDIDVTGHEIVLWNTIY